MDKLKENAYWISVGAIVLVLLLLAYFLVIARIYGGSGDTVTTLGARLAKSLSAIRAYNEREHVPTEEYEAHLKDRLERVRLDHNDGAEVYNDAQKRFNEFFPGISPTDAGLFAPTYREKISGLVEAYRKEFGIKAPVAEENARDRDKDKEEVLVPDVSPLDQSQIYDEPTVRMAMKEYWITEAIFEALTKLRIGGLKKIGFPGRLSRESEETETEFYKTIEITVTVEMPLSKIEGLIAELFGDDRVLFLFDGLVAAKTVEELKPYLTLKKVAEFESRDEADRAKYADVVAEPLVSVDFTFRALDWKGHKILERGDLEKDEEEADEDIEEDFDEEKKK